MKEKWIGAVTFQELKRDNCCGCEACMNACPVDAIKMFPDELGFVYPKTDANKCIDCKLCIKKCPQLQEIREDIQDILVYAGYATKESVVEESSSGGLFTVIAETFLEKFENSSVVSVVWADDFKSVYHTFGKIENLGEMRRSKYIQSRKRFIFREIKEHLENGENILFVGCPCETAGLATFLGEKEYSNLFLIDLVCQGPTSPRVMQEYVDLLEKRYRSKIEDINLRYNGGKKWIPQWINVKFKNGKRYIRVFYETELGNAVHYMQRAACYTCQWNGKRRKSDITLGDYHRPNEDALYYNSKGTSVAIVNAQKGKALMELIPNEKIILDLADYSDIALKNPRIEGGWEPRPGAVVFIENYKKYKLIEAVKRTLPIKKKIRCMLPTWISQIINHRIK